MNNRILLMTALSVSLLSFAACDGTRTAYYPDHSVNTTRRVDNIVQNSSDKKDVVDAEADRITTKMDFDERQIHDKYKIERQATVNELAKSTIARDAKNRGILIQAKHDKDVIDAEVADQLKTSPPEEAAEIRADAASRKSDIDSNTASKLAPIASEAERSKANFIQHGLEIDRDESKEISALEQKRSQARNETKEQKLKIDKWTNDELAKIEKDSSSAK